MVNSWYFLVHSFLIIILPYLCYLTFTTTPTSLYKIFKNAPVRILAEINRAYFFVRCSGQNQELVVDRQRTDPIVKSFGDYKPVVISQRTFCYGRNMIIL